MLMRKLTVALLLALIPYPPGQVCLAYSGFQDIHLGMSLAEFVAKHPAPKVYNATATYSGYSNSPLLGRIGVLRFSDNY